MSKEEIEVGNRLIAEFLGSKYINDAPEDYPNGYYYQPEGLKEDSPIGRPEYFCFHSDWDWLMEVVEKIAKSGNYCLKTSQSLTLSHQWYIYKVSIHENSFEGLDSYIVKIDSDYSNNESKISAYWRFCVEFIKWYNEQGV